MKTHTTLTFFMAIMLMPFMLFAQYPAPLNEANFPEANDSILVLDFTIPATQVFTDTVSANDSLSIDRTLEKALLANNAMDPMSDIAIGGYRNDTIFTFYYMISSKRMKKYNAYSAILPGADSFPTANLHVTTIPTTSESQHTYLKKTATGFYELGFFLNIRNDTMISINNPPRPIAKFPVDYASPNNVENLSIVNTLSVAGMSNTSNITMSITVDAYGDVTIVEGTAANPVYTTHTNYLRLCTYTEYNADLGSGMNFFSKRKIYSYYVANRFEPVATYSVEQIRSYFNQIWWEDHIGFNYTKPFSTASINENESNYFNIFPNPTDGQVIINFENMKEEQISVDIYDISGKLMGSYNKFSNAVEFNLSSYPSGTYIVHMRINDKVFRSKIIRK